MTITIDAMFAGLLLTVIITAMGAYGTLIVIIWQSVNRRLRTLGHEDRDIRNQLHGVMEVMLDANKQRETHYESVLGAMQQSNSLMAHVYTTQPSPDIPLGRTKQHEPE